MKLLGFEACLMVLLLLLLLLFVVACCCCCCCQVLDVLCASSEYDELPVRHNEDVLNTQLARQVGLKSTLDSSFVLYLNAMTVCRIQPLLIGNAQLKLDWKPVGLHVTKAAAVLDMHTA
jgi:hypothetical protein